MQQTEDGGYIIAGSTYSFGDGSDDVYLVKTDGDGKMLWDQTFGGTGNDEGYSVQQTTDGGYIIAGSTDSFGGGWPCDNVYLVKTDADGNKQWQQTFGGESNDLGYSVQQTTDGGYIIAGYTSSPPAGPDIDVYLVKTDPMGNLQWEKTFGGTYSDWGYSVQQTKDGGYIIAGETRISGTSGTDVYLVKTDDGGNLKWQKTFGGTRRDFGYSVQQTKDEGYIITGKTPSETIPYDYDVYLIRLKGTVDLSISDSDISVSPSTPGSTDIKAKVQNISVVDASDILVRFTDENLDTGRTDIIANKTIGNLPAFSDTQLTVSWTPVAGKHKLHVIIDPNNAIEEQREDNNKATKSIDASVDLSILASDISVLPLTSGATNIKANIKAKVDNVGAFIEASDVLVRFIDENLDTAKTEIIADKTIDNLPAGLNTNLTVTWTPVTGKHKIHVILDPNNAINEKREDNNNAKVFFSKSPPVVESVTSKYDGDSDPDVVGTFISNVQAVNTFTAKVTDPDTPDDVIRVVFELGGNKVEDTTSGNGWTADFDMGALSSDSQLKVTAYDKSGLASEPKRVNVKVIPIPSWLIDVVGLTGIKTTFEDGYYTLKADIPKEPIKYDYTIPKNVLLLGGLENLFEAGFTLGIGFHVDGKSKLIAERTLNGKVLGKSAGGRVEVVGVLNPDLSFAGATGTLELKIEAFTIPEVSTTIPVNIYGVQISINLKLGGAINASAKGNATINDQLNITKASINERN